MPLSAKLCFSCCIFILITTASCEKDKVKEVIFPTKDITYVVKGSNIKLNFIDSQSVFQRDWVFKDSFHYAFKKGPGAQIGISIATKHTAHGRRSIAHSTGRRATRLVNIIPQPQAAGLRAQERA